MYRDIFRNSRYVFEEKYGRNLVTAFKKFQDLESWRSSPAARPTGSCRSC